jgi:sucrose-6-phosphate hydrolase SacC (GH32 family)
MTDALFHPTEPRADWLTYHLTQQPQKGLVGGGSDPNGIFFWEGRYHFHYFAGWRDEDSGWSGDAWVHVSSPDLVHWTSHPTTLTPAGDHHSLLSGSGFTTKDGRPAIIYADGYFEPDPFGSGHSGLGPAQIRLALDDHLDSWTAPSLIEPRLSDDADPEIISAWDPHCWLEGDTYYAIFGSQPPLPGDRVTAKKATLHRSTDLVSWDYVGPFLSTELPETERDSDISCPDFFPIGREHMLLCISHNQGCRYYLGEWKDEQFRPTRHGRMNWQPSKLSTAEGAALPDDGRAVFFAPETLLTPDGRRVMWAWCWIDGLQEGIQSLPRELSLPDDGILRIAPIRELEILRSEEVDIPHIEVPPNRVSVLNGVTGDTLECAITIRFRSAHRFGTVVLCDSDGRGGLPITVDTRAETVTVGDVEAPFVPQADSVTLRVFIDKAMVEVFADDRQAVIGAHHHALENIHVGLFADDRVTVDVIAWQLSSIYDEAGQAVASRGMEGALRS